MASIALNMTQSAGSTTTLVEVTTSTDTIQTDNTTLGSTLRNDVYAALPLQMNQGVPRDPTSFITLANVAAAQAKFPGVGLPFPNFQGTISTMLLPFPKYAAPGTTGTGSGGTTCYSCDEGSSSYNSLQVSVQRHLSRGLLRSWPTPSQKKSMTCKTLLLRSGQSAAEVRVTHTTTARPRSGRHRPPAQPPSHLGLRSSCWPGPPAQRRGNRGCDSRTLAMVWNLFLRDRFSDGRNRNKLPGAGNCVELPGQPGFELHR